MTLEERITKLEDIEAIKQLKAFYAVQADRKYTDDHRRKPNEEIDEAARQQASVFTENAIWDGGKQFGVQKGKQAIYEFLRSGAWKFSIHMFLNPIINVNVDKANGEWVLWQTATLENTDQAVFLSAITNDEYIKKERKWFISKTVLTLKFMTPFDVPWSLNKNAKFVF